VADWSRRAAHLALLLCLACAAHAANITVNDNEDVLHSPGCAVTGTGNCTLRDAITFANRNPGPDSVSLAGLTFRPTSPLPVITDDGLTLAGLGSSFLFPNPATIDGSLAGASDGLTIAANGCSISALSVEQFQGTGIVILGSNNSFPVVVGCFGASCFPYVVSANGNAGHGFEIRSGSGNLLAGAAAVENGGNGIFVHGGASTTTIAPAAGPADFNPQVAIGSNGLSGIRIGDRASDTLTQRNTVGRLTTNSGNGGLPVDLAGDCVTPNDPLDADAGPNGLQNFPLVSSSSFNADGTLLSISGTLEGAPNASLTVRFYAAAGQFVGGFVGETAVTTDALGLASFTSSFTRSGTANQPFPVQASATDGAGNTSELGPRPPEAPVTLSFHTTTPCRLLDTRESGGPLKSGIPQALVVAGQCGVPAQTARAVVLNVTVTNATAAGHVSFPAAAPLCQPETSTINFAPGQTRANSATVRLDAGTLLAYPLVANSGTVDLILDVSGYFE
jgi:hypothetical protein